MMAFKVFVKAHTIKDGETEGQKGQLGACPFSHRVLLVLEEKEIPYELEFINLNNKPEWIAKVNSKNSVPVLHDCETGKYICDSEEISDYLEEKYPRGMHGEGTALGKSNNCPKVGENVWSSFMEYLADSAKDRQQLNKELNALENSVGDSMPYVGGKNPCAWDAAIAPRVYLARIGCKTLTQWDFAEEFPNIKAYLHRWMGRSSWRNTASWDEESIADDLRPKMK